MIKQFIIWNKEKIFYLVLFTLFIATPFSFALDSIELVERAKKATVFITAEFEGKTKPKTGTGFVIDTTKSAGLIIVTNKHILEDEAEDKTVKRAQKITVKINLSKLEPTVYNAQIIGMHNFYDLALLYPENMIKVPKDAELIISGDKQYYYWDTARFLLEEHLIDDSDIKEGLEVFLSGYPLNIGAFLCLDIETIRNQPVTRKGIVAQVVPGKNEIILDTFVSPGNSGSPVYCLIGDDIKLLGIHSSVYTEPGYDENNLLRVNSGLAVIIKASVIKDFVYDLIEKGQYIGDWSH